MSLLNIITNQNINKQLSALTFRSGLKSLNKNSKSTIKNTV